MKGKELREWLGFTVADVLCYLALGAVVALYWLRREDVEIPLISAMCLCMVVACVKGMKTDPELSKFMNWLKVWSYPINFAALLIMVMIYFAFFSPRALL